MIDPANHQDLREELAARMREALALLVQLRSEIRVLRQSIRRIQPRNSTATSLVGTDERPRHLLTDQTQVWIHWR